MFTSPLYEREYLLRRAFNYVRRYSSLIILASGVSVIVGVLSGFATYSFLPILTLVFEQGAHQAPASDPLSFSLPWEQWLSGIRFTLSHWLEGVAGEGTLMNRLSRLVGFIVLLNLVNVGLTVVVDYLFTIVQAGGTRALREHVFRHLSQLPLTYYDQMKSGEILSRVANDVGGTISMIAHNISDFILNSFMVVVLIAIMVILNWRLVLLLLPIVIVVTVATVMYGTWVKRNRLRVLQMIADIVTVLQEFLSGMRVIKAFAAEEYEQARWQRYVNKAQRIEIVTNLHKVLPARLSDIVSVAVFAVVLLVGGWLISQQQLAVSELLLFFVLLMRFQKPVSTLARVWWNVQEGLAFAERTFALLDRPTETTAPARIKLSLKNEISFNQVAFSYGEGTVLHDVSFDIPLGKMVALVGPSGSGKSSIASLLLRFYQPLAGTITLDAIDVAQMNLKDYRSLFGVVTQDTFLFHDTVRNNIAYALDHNVSDQEIDAAARTAHAHDFISRLPKGYNTVVGDRGVRLSGGQRQRIALARALIRDPQVLVLDEATSALDSKAERQVQAAIDALISKRTTLVIAHRLSTVVRADQILVLNEGRIVERGAHQQLLSRDGLYRHLWGLQTALH